MTSSTDLANLVTHEVLKVLERKRMMELENKVNFAHIRDYAGMSSDYSFFAMFKHVKPGTWIIDTGASNHICIDLNLMT